MFSPKYFLQGSNQLHFQQPKQFSRQPSLSTQFLLLLLLLVTAASATATNGTIDAATLSTAGRQSSFLEWLSAILSPTHELPLPLPTTTTTTTTITTTTTTPTPIRDCPACKCGNINTITRIVGGQETQVNQYPWMAMLLFRGRFYCGASLINDLYVVSAAHCLRGFTANLVTVRLMVHNRRANASMALNRMVSKVYVHEKYSPRTYDNDIALLKLAEPITMNDMMRPVCLASPTKSYDHDEAIVTGWGAISEGGPLAANLQEVRVPILSHEECQRSGYGSGRITKNMLCAGVPKGGKDSCQGDSGGPLHVVNKEANSYHLVGIVSWGEGCARPRLPGIYTRVSRYLQWINQRAVGACSCDVPSKNDTPSQKAQTESHLNYLFKAIN